MKRDFSDITTDILRVVTRSVGKAELMALANLSHRQCEKYLPILQRLDLITEQFDGRRTRYQITDRGSEFLSKSDPKTKRDSSFWAGKGT